MRKVYLFLTLMLTIGFFNAQAVYVPITHTSGTVVVGTINVTVTPLNSPNIGNFCGTGPYQIGKNYSDGYQYDFGAPVTHVRFEMTRIHNDDTLQIDIDNGTGYTQYNLTAGNLTAFAGNCTMTSVNMITPGGLLSTTGGATGPGQGTQVDISLTPALIYGVRVRHIRHVDNNIASDVYYNAYLQDDSCSLGFEAKVDSPICSGRNVQLTSTVFPNTTYQWTWNVGAGTPNLQPSANVSNPVITGITSGHGGQYFVAATRGTCVYRDTVNVVVTPSPVLGPVVQAGPVCPNDDDTLFVPNVSLPIGGNVYATSSLGTQTFDPSQGYILEFDEIQTSQANIFYYIYAEDIQGCRSDTVAHLMLINEDVYASFTTDIKEGCEFDTVKFNNTSTTDGVLFITSTWNFGDGTPTITDTAPTHHYQVPTPNWYQRDYTVRLIADNGKCRDTIPVTISINHPVKAEFEIDDDSICQGDTISFRAEDSSYVKPGTIPEMRWRFGDGGKDTALNPTHVYYNAGVYNPVFVLTDYLGCSDSFTLPKPIIVDSSGYVLFETNRESVCVGEEIIFKGQYSVFGYISATWDFGDGVTIPDDTVVYHSYAEPGTYDVTFDIKYRICPDTAYTGQYVVKPIPKVYLGEDTSICPNGEPVFIEDRYRASNPPSTTYRWHTPTEDVTPGIAVRHHGSYSVTADLDGCTASDTIVIDKNCYINIPNVFTPNGDGNGDYFLPRQLLSRSVSRFEMHIYNRWGEKVFETNALNGRGWDGKYGGDDQPLGVYIYLINVTFANGITERYQGNVTLLR